MTYCKYYFKRFIKIDKHDDDKNLTVMHSDYIERT